MSQRAQVVIAAMFSSGALIGAVMLFLASVDRAAERKRQQREMQRAAQRWGRP